MAAITTILVPIDFSDASQAAVEYGSELASAFGASLHLLHVVNEPLHETWACYAPGQDFLRVVDELQRQARNRLRPMLPLHLREKGQGVLATAWGDPSDEILKYAREHAVDLIVCGTHGRRGWDLVAMGSVASRLVRLARCPVLTVPGSRPPAAAAA